MGSVLSFRSRSALDKIGLSGCILETDCSSASSSSSPIRIDFKSHSCSGLRPGTAKYAARAFCWMSRRHQSCFQRTHGLRGAGAVAWSLRASLAISPRVDSIGSIGEFHSSFSSNAADLECSSSISHCVCALESGTQRSSRNSQTSMASLAAPASISDSIQSASGALLSAQTPSLEEDRPEAWFCGSWAKRAGGSATRHANKYATRRRIFASCKWANKRA